MNNPDLDKLQLLPDTELELRLARLRDLMSAADIDAVLISSNSNIYYLTGRIFCGYIFIPLAGSPVYAVRRPSILKGDGIEHIRKIEDLPSRLGSGFSSLGLEMADTSYLNVCRFRKAFGDRIRYENASGIMTQARSVKTGFELEKIRFSGIKHTSLYERIPHIYRQGMSDIDLQIEIERAARHEGCLGLFRINGDDMELFMGNILVGDNADCPSPYDFAMGGAGLDPSLPVGADGSLIRPGKSIMVDVNGNFTGYMTDMTRCYVAGTSVPEKAEAANKLSADICRAVADAARPGAKAADLYHLAAGMAADAGMEEYFMGHRSHAGFVGHGVGIEINELPVIAPRSRDILAAGNAIALEPKFVLPGIGAVGVENTYLVGSSAPGELITKAPQNIVALD